MCRMKFSFQFVALLFAAVANGFSEEHAWNDYKLKHGKDYTTFFGGGWRDKMRKNIFLAERQLVNQHNRNESRSYSQELNRFSDMRPSEKSGYLGVKSSMAPSIQFMKSIHGDDDLPQNRKTLPEAFDYRTDNCMAAVKDQKKCGSCWAFAAVAPIEFNYCKKHKQTPIVLSEQQLVDCDKIDGGCTKGGWHTMAWKYIKLSGGITRQSLYPYTATRNVCPRWFWYSVAGAQVFKFSYVPTQNTEQMQVALQKHGPLAVAIAVANSFFSYRDGVYDAADCDSVNVNHAVVVVGWGSRDGIDYWIVRNSWGTGWGLSGYVLIKRGVNKCQIESYPAYVVPF